MKITRLAEIIDAGLNKKSAWEIAEEIKEELNDQQVWGEDVIE
jgi:hypothetical protein